MLVYSPKDLNYLSPSLRNDQNIQFFDTIKYTPQTFGRPAISMSWMYQKYTFFLFTKKKKELWLSIQLIRCFYHLKYSAVKIKGNEKYFTFWSTVVILSRIHFISKQSLTRKNGLFLFFYFNNVYKFESHLMMCWKKIKKVLKTHLFSKIFHFLYRSFVSIIKI